MPITEDRLTRLQRFGLSEYAARAYLALLDLGEAEARDISAMGRIPMGKIYHALDQLHEEGLVLILPESPKRYAPTAFDAYVSRLQRSHTEAIRSLEQERGELGGLFRILGNTEVGSRGGFTILRGRRNVLDKSRELFAETSQDWLVLAVSGFAQRYLEELPELKRARERGVRIRFLVPLTEATCERLTPLAEASEVRHRDVEEGTPGSNVSLIIADGARALLINFVPNDESSHSTKDIAVFTDQQAIVDAIRGLVEPSWQHADTFERRCEELKAGREPEFATFLRSYDEARERVLATVEEAASPVTYVSAVPVGTSGSHDCHDLERMARAGSPVRAILNLADHAGARATEDLVRRFPQLEVRHLPPGTLSRFWVVGHEAFFSHVRPGPAPAKPPKADLIVHTNSRDVLESLEAHFDELWNRAETLAERQKALQ
ncbi:MAG TPA: helix-turn-helix domain-containing protein [Candidatus Thermoplasmatota archaeon]|nr:helix-turn-helix domain-containing protein [Candidatus Thermoplasmatota archaeon]